MKKIIVLILAAALIVGVFAACSNSTQQSEQERITSPASADAAIGSAPPSPQKDDLPQNIIYGEGDIIGSLEPGKGEYKLSGGVSQALHTNTDPDALLYVRFSIYSDSGQDFYKTFTFEGKTHEEWRASIESISREYDDGYKQYHIEEDTKMNWEEVETTAQKEAILSARRSAWNESWMQTHDINPIEENLRFYVAFETAKSERRKARVLAEHERLTAHGLNVLVRMATRQDDFGYIFEYYYLVGYLTAEQIRSFPCGEYGYVIMWADKEDIVDA